MDGNTSKVGLQIIKLRKKRGLTQKDLAQQSGISQSYLSEIERGVRPCSPRAASKIAKVVGSSIFFYSTVLFVSLVRKLPKESQKRIRKFVYQEVRDATGKGD